jgi:release factor glutamine methyltransferase
LLFVKNGIRITECHHVYRPREDSDLLSEAVERLANGKTLDIGTGTGIQGIIAAKKGCEVTFSDVSIHAIRCARHNAEQNGVEGEFVTSDLFEYIKGRFDTIIFNPPYLESARLGAETKDYLKIATDGGEDGRELINRFINDSFNHLSKTGRVIMVESTVNKYDLDIEKLNAQVLSKKHMFFEDIVVITYKNNKKSGVFNWK